MSSTIRRRSLLRSACAFGVALPALGRADTISADPAASAPPEADDLIVFAFGDREGQVVKPDDLTLGAEQVFAYAKQSGTDVVRNGTRLYQIVLVRLEPSWLSAETLARSVDGVVAYSGVCTHTGCDVMDWDEDVHHFQCPCHESQFDPSDGARVVGGPAPWPLAALPLKRIGGQLAVARPFEGRLGFLQPGQSLFGI